MTVRCSGLGGLPGGGMHEQADPRRRREGTADRRNKGRRREETHRTEIAADHVAVGVGVLAEDRDLAGAPQRPTLPLLISAAVACTRGPGWGGPTHHLPSPFVLTGPARCPTLHLPWAAASPLLSRSPWSFGSWLS